MIQGGLRLIWDFIFQSTAMLGIFFLYLDYRDDWNQKRTFIISIFFMIVQAIFAGSSHLWSVKFGINFAAILGMICVIFKNVFWEKLFVFLLFSFVHFFSETMFVFTVQLLLPSLYRQILMVPIQNSSFREMVLSYSRINSLCCFSTVTLGTVIMLLIFMVSRRKQLSLSGRKLRPFIPFFLLQLSLIMVIDITSIFNKGSLSIVILLIALLLIFSIFLWMIWQIMITAKRTDAELELKQFLYLNQKSLNYYACLREKVLHLGTVRHDFNNQIAIARFMIEEGDAENLNTARNIISELIENLELKEESAGGN